MERGVLVAPVQSEGHSSRTTRETELHSASEVELSIQAYAREACISRFETKSKHLGQDRMLAAFRMYTVKLVMLMWCDTTNATRRI